MHAHAARYAPVETPHSSIPKAATNTTSEIDHNFSKAHRIVTSSIIPTVEAYAHHSQNVWEGSKVSPFQPIKKWENGPDLKDSSGNNFLRLQQTCHCPGMKSLR